MYSAICSVIYQKHCLPPTHTSQASGTRNILKYLKPQLRALLQKVHVLVKVGNEMVLLNQYAKEQFFCLVSYSLVDDGQVTQSSDYLKSTVKSKKDCIIRLELRINDVSEQLRRCHLQVKGQSTTPVTSAHTLSPVISIVFADKKKALEEKKEESSSLADLSVKQKLTENTNNTILLSQDSQVSYSSDSLPPVQELLSDVFTDIQDSTGNTALHSVIETQEDVDVGFVLKSVQSAAECLEVKNEDELTPLNLAFQKKLWAQAHVLAERQIQTRRDCVLLQEYFFRAMREQGGVDFLPHLLDLQERYFPDLDLNFSTYGRGHTPWWYLANSNDVSVMCRALQTLKNHSVDLMHLLTHTEKQTRLVEEAAEKNRLLFRTIQKVVGNGVDQDNADGDEMSSHFGESLSQITSCSSFPSFDEVENLVSEPYKMPVTGSQSYHMFSNKNRSTTIRKIAGDKNETSSDFTGTLSRTTSSSSISTTSSFDQSV